MWTWHVSMNCKDYFDVWKYIDVCLEEYKWLIPHAWIRRIQKRAALEKGKGWKGKTIPFSAFWLRSSVVSVLISLISDTWFIEPHDIKCIFLGGGPTHNSLLLGLSGVACALHYSTSLAHPDNTTQNDDELFVGLNFICFCNLKRVHLIWNVCISFHLFRQRLWFLGFSALSGMTWFFRADITLIRVILHIDGCGRKGKAFKDNSDPSYRKILCMGIFSWTLRATEVGAREQRLYLFV